MIRDGRASNSSVLGCDRRALYGVDGQKMGKVLRGAPLLARLTASDLPFCWQPQRGSNPCLHLERDRIAATAR
jgi:hypothetical protein